jgi:hypothetical protein
MADCTETDLEPGHVSVYSAGLVYASACAPGSMPLEQVEAAVNAQSPTGISSRWSLAGEPFADGTPNPGPCEQEPACRHYLLSC